MQHNNNSNDDEILNIDYHVKKMIIQALNHCEKKIHVISLLGISERTLYRKMHEFKIHKGRDGIYFSTEYVLNKEKNTIEIC